ncbi:MULTISPECIES: YggS family pyridoxal phosphate-dependent enzyme [unclassified Schaalia]|uniref:YggS family pyridoxal phosphate-dependent enzyme n=1 Tax=unclassified Schaalia TaxID=2691889 RepID=UPI001E384874|nr:MULTISPECIES: YggS family pyridoxal phosphate-dependent enzyme [unclassified Schaalia]MCD4549276.1 YggS family pyridoxal phosphate-dependent enzyme [Schaalia sp. lx-260]MCD4557085.1 YggS family pyridoxal phosphate-dependent enzyme [Schaalia sp. lx-100]
MSIERNIDLVYERIEHACETYGRTDAVVLQIAAKTQSADSCFQAAQHLSHSAHPILLGHNRVQEARDTAEAIHAIPHSRIHLIGPLQSNKINMALSCVDAIDTLDRVDIIEPLSKRLMHPLPVMIQVNVSGEITKSGCAPTVVNTLVDAVNECDSLILTGFMTVGLNSSHEAPVRRAYEHLRLLRDRTAQRLNLPENALELSMGMSHDLEWAIAEGSTRVRVGTAIFGPRIR